MSAIRLWSKRINKEFFEKRREPHIPAEWRPPTITFAQCGMRIRNSNSKWRLGSLRLQLLPRAPYRSITVGLAGAASRRIPRPGSRPCLACPASAACYCGCILQPHDEPLAVPRLTANRVNPMVARAFVCGAKAPHREPLTSSSRDFGRQPALLKPKL